MVTTTPGKEKHKEEVLAFLCREFSSGDWVFTTPHGHGQETYIARSGQEAVFIKLEAHVERYRALADSGITPPVLATGTLDDGVAILVQTAVTGRTPRWRDYRTHLEGFAAIIRRMHACPALQQILPPVTAQDYRQAALTFLAALHERWEKVKVLVPREADLVDYGLAILTEAAASLEGEGLVASHNDICNANWIITAEERLYLVDLESMSADDPAVDIGATLWWYVPPVLRPRFLQAAGHANEPGFDRRMQVRMAMHCLHILLPRQDTFDRFDAAGFATALIDFRACLAGGDNPHGYDDD